MAGIIDTVKQKVDAVLKKVDQPSAGDAALGLTKKTDSKMGDMTAMRFPAPNTELQLARVPIPAPDNEEVRIKIYAAGVCATDHFTQHNIMNNAFPRVPGHEVAGIIDEIGPNVKGWSKGDRVGVGWTAFYCGRCDCCRDGNTSCCEKVQATGINLDGGYEEYMVCHYSGLARIPEGVTFIEAAPLMDAGLTVFNALRNSVARANDLVAIVGIGGLGHLGIQFANKMGFRVAAVSHTADKKDDCMKLGAHYFIDSSSQDAGQQLLNLGGVKAIMFTATTNEQGLFDSLAKAITTQGQFMLITTLTEPVPLTALNLLIKRASITVWNTGDAKDIEETLQFAQMHDIHPIVEVYPLNEAAKAYSRCQNSETRYRGVLKIREEY